MDKYTLVKPENKLRNKFIVTIVADSNDGDYVTTEETYSKDSFDEYAADALIDLLNNYSDSYELPKYPNEGDLYIPYNGYDGSCHSLESVSVRYIDNDGESWDVELNLNTGEEI